MGVCNIACFTVCTIRLRRIYCWIKCLTIRGELWNMFLRWRWIYILTHILSIYRYIGIWVRLNSIVSLHHSRASVRFWRCFSRATENPKPIWAWINNWQKKFLNELTTKRGVRLVGAKSNWYFILHCKL